MAYAMLPPFHDNSYSHCGVAPATFQLYSGDTLPLQSVSSPLIQAHFRTLRPRLLDFHAVCHCQPRHIGQLAYRFGMHKPSPCDSKGDVPATSYFTAVGDLAERRPRLLNSDFNSYTAPDALSETGVGGSRTAGDRRSGIHGMSTIPYGKRAKLISNRKPACMRKTMKPAKSNNKTFVVRVNA